MASEQGVVDFIVDQIDGAGNVSARKMFGEYGVYCDGKIIGLICDDQFFVKPTEPGRAFVDDVTEASPYPGAKPSMLISAERWDDRTWMAELVRITTQALPAPKKKKKPRSKK